MITLELEFCQFFFLRVFHKVLLLSVWNLYCFIQMSQQLLDFNFYLFSRFIFLSLQGVQGSFIVHSPSLLLCSQQSCSADGTEIVTTKVTQSRDLNSQTTTHQLQISFSIISALENQNLFVGFPSVSNYSIWRLGVHFQFSHKKLCTLILNRAISNIREVRIGGYRPSGHSLSPM